MEFVAVIGIASECVRMHVSCSGYCEP